MIERETEIQTKDGAMNTFIACPDEGGPFPVVIFYMDAPGKREELHDMARRIAAVGYYVVLPSLYYRTVREFNLFAGETRERMFELMGSLSNALVNEDTAAILSFLEGEEKASGGPVATVGYCMSGPFVFAGAAAFPDRIAAAASIHGVALYTDRPDSPHLTADQVKGELYFACAEKDAYAPPDMIDPLDAHLKKAGVNYRIEWYPETDHGFVFPTRDALYVKSAAERHWVRLFDLFRRTIG